MSEWQTINGREYMLDDGQWYIKMQVGEQRSVGITFQHMQDRNWTEADTSGAISDRDLLGGWEYRSPCEDPRNEVSKVSKVSETNNELEMSVDAWRKLTLTERARRNLPAYMAMINGEPTEYYHNGSWHENLDDDTDTYHPHRPKPVPMEVWVNVYDDGVYDAYASEREAVHEAPSGAKRVAVHMREVV